MKSKIIYIFLTGFVMFSITSCEDLLEEDPKTFISPNNFFTSYDDFDAAVKGIYGITHSLTGGRQTEVKEVFADYNDLPESAENTSDMWRNNPGSNFAAILQGWSVPYRVISNANLVLSSLEGSVLTDSQKSTISAEAKFLRAYAYFQLVQLYGDVPLRTVPVQSVKDGQIERSPQSDIYDLILEDLTEAETGLPTTSSQEGRVNSYVAKALLARVYLTMAGNPMNVTANYALAKTKALEVIDGPYTLLEDFADVFKNTTYTSESIWEVIYLIGTSNNGKHNQTAPTGNQTAILLPSDDFISSFPVGDRRNEWGIQDTYTTTGGTEFVSRTYYNKFIDESQLEAELPPASAQSDYTFPLIRLAEMYLIAAEAENEMNGPDGAYQYINEVRRRARVDKGDVTHVPDLTGLSQAQFTEAISDERKWELFTEEHAWYDLKRTNSFDQVQLARGADLIVPIGSYNNTWILPELELINNDIDDNPAYGG